MGKFNIKYRCGHDGRINVFGKSSERQKKADWVAENNDCYACVKAAYKAKWIEENQRRIELSKKEGAEAVEKISGILLPELIGSEKQIDWANQIRAKVLVENPELISVLLKKTRTRAVYWIDNRFCKDWKSLIKIGRRKNDQAI